MAAARFNARELTRLFDAAAEPTYALDGNRRLVFCNQALAGWLGTPRESLLGIRLDYHSEGIPGGASLAHWLCPPPRVFAGESTRAPIMAPPLSSSAEGDEVRGDKAHDRIFEFTPFHDAAGEVVLVLARALSADEMSEDSANLIGPTAEALHARVQRFRRESAEHFHVDRLVGECPRMRQVRSQVELASGNHATVTIVGPPGSGRQIVARVIHHAGARAWRDLPLENAERKAPAIVPLACQLLGAELLQSTIRALVRPRVSGGGPPSTLLLNHVDCMPMEAQNELAGFLGTIDLPVRILATSRKPLAEAASEGAFRADLARYLSTLTIMLPPLVERIDDLALVAQWFVERANAEGKKQISGLTLEAIDRLTDYSWPGDVAELGEVVAAAHRNAEGLEIAARDLPERILLAREAERFARRPEETIDLDSFLGRIERELIERALARAKGNKTQAARLLGLNRPRLYRRLVQLGMEQEDAEATSSEEADE